MAGDLFKLVMSSTAPTTNAVPTASRYFYTQATAFSGTSLEIAVADLKDDSDATPSSITLAAANNGYYQIFINGVIQQSGILAVVADKITLTFSASKSIPVNSVIVLVVTNFAPTTTAPTITG